MSKKLLNHFSLKDRGVQRNWRHALHQETTFVARYLGYTRCSHKMSTYCPFLVSWLLFLIVLGTPCCNVIPQSKPT